MTLPNRLLAGSAFLALASIANSVSAGSILGLNNEGDIYSIDTSTGAATLFRDYSDTLPVSGTDDANSPNGLAFDGTNDYFTTFGVNPTDWYRNGADTGTDLPGGGSAFEVAAADVYQNTYYYINRNGDFYSVANAATTTDASGATKLGTIANTQYGDLAIDPTTGNMYVSYGNVGLRQHSLADGTAIGSEIAGQDNGSIGRWAGLGFDLSTGILYGVTGGAGADSELWKLDITGTIAASKVGDVKLADGTALQLTDAATVVPIPAAAWLFGSALLGMVGIGYRRKQRSA